MTVPRVRRVVIMAMVFSSISWAYQSSFAQQNSLLWEISGNNLRQSSYLFGTIHLICPGGFVPGDSLKHALNSAEKLILELDMTDPGLTAALMSSMNMKGGKKLPDLMSEEEFHKTSAFFRDSLGFDVNMLARTKPFFLASVLFSYILNCPIESVEGKLTELANANGTPVTGLEIPENQAAVFDSIPYEIQAQMVVRMIDSMQTAKTEFSALLALYHAQDIEKIRDYSGQSQFDFDDFEKVLLSDRNRKWMTKIEHSVQHTSSFIAVGAAHLGGADGIIQLLREQGYRLRPVQNR